MPCERMLPAWLLTSTHCDERYAGFPALHAGIWAAWSALHAACHVLPWASQVSSHTDELLAASASRVALEKQLNTANGSLAAAKQVRATRHFASVDSTATIACCGKHSCMIRALVMHANPGDPSLEYRRTALMLGCLALRSCLAAHFAVAGGGAGKGAPGGRQRRSLRQQHRGGSPDGHRGIPEGPVAHPWGARGTDRQGSHRGSQGGEGVCL